MSSSPSTSVLVRGVPSTFSSALAREPAAIDVDSARRQHENYVATLRRLGARVEELLPDDRHPDCVFIEDTAVVIGDRALITRSGAPSRRGEEEETLRALRPRKKVVVLEAPLHLDGGDVFRAGDRLYVGRSTRTHPEAIDALRSIFDLPVVALEVGEALHLKSYASAPWPGVVVVAEEFIPMEVFSREIDIVTIPRNEARAANVVAVGEKAILHEGYPETRRILEDRGIECVAVDASEFAKADGSLTCLSIFL